MVGTIVVRQKDFNLSQPGIEPRSLDLQEASTARKKCIIYLNPEKQGIQPFIYWTPLNRYLGKQ